MDKASFYSLVFALPITLALAAFYATRWGAAALKLGFSQTTCSLPTFLVVLFGGVVMHEALHGLTWAFFGRKPLRTIKFGFQWKTLTPYAHSREPLEINAYRLGTGMPGFVLGILPWLMALLTGTHWLAAFGLFFTLVAGGDMLILWLTRHVKAGRRVADHPTEAGCSVLD
ncbi:hypothetical protein GCM10023187_26040 [Nibrella viscosa]|uniref:Zincin peptidase n=2 Tax=Nibrella viscosa TaxID=1084524 RepID=A0ABP8KHC8_9BACT